MTPEEACLDRQFCCTIQENSDGTKQVVLKRNHLYFAQVQGQMAVGERPWCDFVIYTTKGLSIHRVPFECIGKVLYYLSLCHFMITVLHQR